MKDNNQRKCISLFFQTMLPAAGDNADDIKRLLKQHTLSQNANLSIDYF
jgi:hypothetical protein